MAKLLGGIVTAMLTPFTSEDELDIPALENLCDYLIDRGVDCLYPLGSMGEMLRMSTQERKLAAQAVVRKAAGRVPVYVHIGSITTRETVELAQHAQSIGADGVGVVTPMYFPLGEREMEAFYDDVASSTDLPVYLYVIPQFACNDISPDLAARLSAKHKNIVGIKCSMPDFARTRAYIAIDGFEVLQGCDYLTLPLLAMDGVKGIVSGNSSACPETYVAVRRALENNDLVAARRVDEALRAYSTAMGNGNLALEKAFLALRGLPFGTPRKPGLPVTDSQFSQLRETVQALDARYSALLR